MKPSLPLLALLVGAFVLGSAAPAPDTHASLLAQARQYAAEKSWALARKAYAAAGELAPDDDARRWCALWAVEAGLHLSYNDGVDPAAMSKEHAALLDPYDQGRTRDDFWFAALEVRAAATRRGNYYPRPKTRFWEDVVTGADELGQQSATTENAARYAAFLLRHLEGIFDPLPPIYRDKPQYERLLIHLRAASEGPLPDQDRLLLKLYVAHVSERHGLTPSAVEDAYAAAASVAPDSPAAALARAAALAWRARHGRLTPDADGYPKVPAWLHEIHSALDDLRQTPDHILNRQARRELETLHLDWHAPRLTVAVPPLYRANEPVAFGIGAAMLDRLTLSLYRIAPADWPASPNIRGVKFEGIPARAERIAEWSTALDGAPRYAWQTRFEAPPSPLAPGLYAVIVRGDDVEPVARYFTVSSASAICLSTPAGIEYFVYDNESGAPWPDRPVRVVYSAAPGRAVYENVTFDTRTDAHGRTSPHPAPAETNEPFRQLLIADGHPVWLPTRANQAGTYEDENVSLQLDLFMDRALFRPGETVNWKLVGRLSRDGRLEIPRRPFTFDVRLHGEPLIPQQTLQWSNLGTVHGSFVIPADARPGKASLVLNQRENEAGFVRPMGWARDAAARVPSNRTPVESRSHSLDFFTVDNFRPPPARLHLELAGDRTALRPGGTATFRLRAEYFSGGPVTHAPVTFRLQAYPYLLYSTKPHSPELVAWTKTLQTPRTAVTDAQGTATVQVDIPASIPDELPFFIGASLELNGAAAVAAHRMTAITATGLNLELASRDPYNRHQPEWDWVLPGETLPLRYRFLDPFGSPVSVEGEAVLQEQRWREIWLDDRGRPVAGEALNEVRRRHGMGPEALPALGWTRLVSEEVTTTAASVASLPDAEGWHTTSLAVPHAGVFRLTFRNVDDEIRPRHDHIEQRFPRPIRLLAADEHTTSLDLPPEQSLLLHRPAPSPGGPPQFLALFPDRIRHGLLTFATPQQVHTVPLAAPERIRVVAPTDSTGLETVGVARLLIPGKAYPAVVNVGSTKRVNRFTTTLVKTSSNDRPGETSAWTLTTRDAAGRPVRAEVAVGVSDEAVNRLLPRPPLPAPPFHGYQRLQPAHSKASGLWQPGAAILEGWDPRLGLAGYRTRHDATAQPSGLRSLALIAERYVSTDVSDHGAHALAAAEGRSSGPTQTEQALAGVPLPEAAAESDPTITVRRHFVSTAFWAPQIETDANGEATFRFDYPDNLTEWRVSAYSVGHDGESFGAATTLVPSSLPFQARLLTPRMLVAGDSTELTATLLNRTAQPVVARASLSLEGPVQPGDGAAAAPLTLAVPAEGDRHARWPVKATAAGDALVTLRAHVTDSGDAMQVSLPVVEDGLQQATSASAHLAADRTSARLAFVLPDELDRARTNVTVHLAPNRARAILDALPYLVDYPYGCVEQTVSRFLPAIVVRRTLTDLGFSVEEIERHALRNETSSARRRRLGTAGLGRLDDVVNESLRRLEDLRGDYGLYGWWGPPATADLWMTGYALLGLSIAKAEGYHVSEGSHRSLVENFSRVLAGSKNTSSAEAVALALLVSSAEVDGHEGLQARFESLYAERERLAPAGRAGMLIAAKVFGTAEQRAILLRNLENGATRTRDASYGDTVHWGRVSDCWLAEESAVESTALTLIALLDTDPRHPDIPAALHWLVLNRRSGHWTNTRDTALAVLALSRTLDRTDGKPAKLEVDLLLNGRPLQRLTIDREALLSPDLVLELDPAALRPGENELELRRASGQGPLYAVALASAWAPGDSVKPHGHLASADRVFVRHATRPTLLRTLEVTPTPLPDGGAATAGERVTAHVRLNFPHDLDYVMVEVPKPAGCEPVNPLSAWDALLVTVEADAPPGSTETDKGQRPVYREEHDGKSVFFLSSVAAGTSELRFQLRAVHPGDYRALPVHVEAMYVPEVRANSDARRVSIVGAENPAGAAQ